MQFSMKKQAVRFAYYWSQEYFIEFFIARFIAYQRKSGEEFHSLHCE